MGTVELSTSRDHLMVFLGSFALHSALFFAAQRISPQLNSRTYNSLSNGDRAEWDSRVVSNIQAVLATLGAFRWIYHDWATIQTDFDFAFGGSDIRHFYMMFTAGYLAYDLILCLWYFRSFGEFTTITHHVVILVAYTLGLYYHFGSFYMGFFLINEISTPFLNVRWFLFKAGYYEEKVYEWNGYALALSFFVSRVVFNLIAVEHMTRGFVRFYSVLIAKEDLPVGILYFLPVLAWIHVLINLYWFWLILDKVLRKLGIIKEKGTKGKVDGKSPANGHKKED